MTNSMKRNPRGGRGPRAMLYALGILVAIMAAVLVKTTTVSNTGLSTASLTSFNPLTVAPIANQASDTGIPVAPIAPTATDAQTSPYPVITWAATGLPPGITMSRVTGIITGTPTLAGTYDVTIQAKDNAHPPTYGSTSFNWYVGNMAPVVSQVLPVVSQGVGGIRVVITGHNFLGASSVKFGPADAGVPTVNRYGTKITVFAPSETSGTVDVIVTAFGGTSTPTPADQFTYLAPNISLVSNTTGSVGGGTRVRISGTGFAGTTAVRFGGVSSTDFTVRNNGTQLTAVAPPGTSGSVQITVVTPGGVTSTGGGQDFTYFVPAPPAPHPTHTKK